MICFQEEATWRVNLLSQTELYLQARPNQGTGGRNYEKPLSDAIVIIGRALSSWISHLCVSKVAGRGAVSQIQP